MVSVLNSLLLRSKVSNLLRNFGCQILLLENRCRKLQTSVTFYERNALPSSLDDALEILPKDFSYHLTDELKPRSQKQALSQAVDYEYLDTVAPPLQKSFNFAPYADKSEVLQQLVKLGVDLSVIEAKGTEISKQILTLSFNEDVKPIIQFLHSHRVPPKEYGSIITRNPYIFQQDLRNLNIRVGYFTSKGFDANSVARIISRAPRFLNMNTKTIDSRLGFVQKEFRLTDSEVRFLIIRNPKLLLTNIQNVKDITFCIREEMGFDNEESKALLLSTPRIWMTSKNELSERFEYLHHKMGISHKGIVNFPGCLICRKFIFQQRHEYLVRLGRAQYDPTLPNYVSLKTLISGKDEAFCWTVAKTSVADYNRFLKSF